ncbi:pyrroloquinoline quinone biosynthesis protein D [Oceanospirillum multiglobuliferum]|uniref:Pyrroloquinoline quinone biosynthesis protein PqqD n=1 Tax=Oceanospirillum multiglobuliferum TaxID=64969 RepID=A0A1T4S5P8_9GAMM|nr:pyrroloquinoline quinone biosynthesis peptide chaperone PqqD [Oceanospirillum multiglobuliferum]OPX54456.1 pyrroloquinoline quinone biosynthesis protein PqqD [Oceanospirillum multiglobuliferum]SKA23406.1 pyrroloquinoline quinone biosynthesis protein D [Oceanospirillum multiglobuliferum]
MTENSILTQIPILNRLFRFQWEPSSHRHVLLYPEGMVQLNESAGAILTHVDGERSIAQIIEALQAQFPEADDSLIQDVIDFFTEAHHELHWIEFT